MGSLGNTKVALCIKPRKVAEPRNVQRFTTHYTLKSASNK